jgi:predicted DNA-binding ribbon-helix-helix protein
VPGKIVKRTQTGVRLESTLLKTLKALAEYLDITLGDLLEGIVLHAFDNKTPFSDETLSAIRNLKEVYNCELSAVDSHQLTEAD